MKKLFVIGTSAGGMEALKAICAGLPADFPGAVLVVMHIGANESRLPTILSRNSQMPVSFAQDGQLVEESTIVIAPADRHLLVRREGERARLALSHGAKENFTRPAIDPLFRSAAAEFGNQVVGVVLSGYLDDGTVGLKAIKECGGLAIVQEPLHSPVPDMPSSAIDHVDVDLILEPDAIALALLRIARGELSDALAAPADGVPEWIEVENKFASNCGDMDDLQRIAVPSRYTCPECSGALFEVVVGGIRRFRCHTGHSFTSEGLGKLQERAVEEALWSALRALHEQAALATQRSHEVSSLAAGGHQAAAHRATRAASIIRKLLVK